MTGGRVDQLVFGYEEGHRLLGGSTEIPPSVLAHLLGATDAAVESASDRLVTGFPLDAVGRYALCFTWNARELPRPGAVWSHVLLVKPQHFELPTAVTLLRDLARRPVPYALHEYDTALSLGDIPVNRRAVSDSLLEAIANAVYEEGHGVVVHRDLAEAEEALFAVWEAQWPKLRARFEFRTRESTRVFSGSGVVVARRVRGMTRHGAMLEPQAWISQLAGSIAQPTSRLQRFLTAFGPNDAAESSTMRALTRLYCQIESQDCAAVRDALESRYPDKCSGQQLKDQLFGKPRGSWWASSEASRLGTILGATVDGWNLEALAFETRLNDWFQRNGVHPLIQELNSHGPKTIREALLRALLHSGQPSDLPAVARTDLNVAATWLAENPVIGWEPDAWHGLESEQVTAVLATPGLHDSTSVLAATLAGHANAAIQVVGLSTAFSSAARTRNYAAAKALLDASDWTNALKISARDAEIALLLAAISDGRGVPGLLAALESRRDVIDGTWLRAAAVEISRLDRPPGKVLEVVFGPLYHAVKDDRLPSVCWEFLNRVLPNDGDPAARFRRLLSRVATDEGWRQKKCRRALRGVGPYASELYRELNKAKVRVGRIKKLMEWL